MENANKSLPTFVWKNWALPTFIWAFGILCACKSGQMARKSGQMASFEIKSGQKNWKKMAQKQLKMLVLGSKMAFLRVFEVVFRSRGQMPTFFLY